MENTVRGSQLNPYHVDVLDGIRALAVLIIVWFHFWQQSWLMPVFSVPISQSLGWTIQINLDFIPRSGFIFVDLMLLISAFCLFLPHARAMLLDEAVPDTRRFYQKRAAKILPPYLLSVLAITFLWALPTGAFTTFKKFCTDFFSTLTFTQTFFSTTLLDSKINGVLWTAAVEVQFYLLFPLLARCFRKRPLFTYAGMCGVAFLYIYAFALRAPDSLRTSANQLPAFFGVFANGMLAAYLYVFLCKKVERKRWISLAATVAACFCLYAIGLLEKSVTQTNPVQVWQLSYRYPLSVVFCVFILCAALSANWFRAVFSNRVMRFLAAISYNLYIWHQWLSVRFVEWKIPYWAGEMRPNQAGNRAWQWKYTLLVTLVSLALAALITYVFEKPIYHKLLAPRARSIKEEPQNETV